jgi:hypothetical protein
MEAPSLIESCSEVVSLVLLVSLTLLRLNVGDDQALDGEFGAPEELGEESPPTFTLPDNKQAHFYFLATDIFHYFS